MNNIEFDKEYICYIGNIRMTFYTNDYIDDISFENRFGKFIFHRYKDVVLMCIMKDGLLYRYVLCTIDYFNKKTFDYYEITVIDNE